MVSVSCDVRGCLRERVSVNVGWSGVLWFLSFLCVWYVLIRFPAHILMSHETLSKTYHTKTLSKHTTHKENSKTLAHRTTQHLYTHVLSNNHARHNYHSPLNNYANASTSILTEQYNPCNKASNKSQAPEDGCINIRNMLSSK